MADPVERFRRLTGKSPKGHGEQGLPPVPPRERALVGLLLLNVAWLTFALGGVRLWGLSTAMLLSLGTLFLLPLWKRGEYPANEKPVFRLLRHPLFWLGLGLYAYISIQSWNLTWEWTYAPDGRPKLISVAPLIPWLPTGVLSPIDENNPFRGMMFLIIPWISCSAMWVGLTTRRSIRLLLHGLAWMGVLFTLIALYQHFLDKERILGIFPTVPLKADQPIPFWGTLINENHAAFYLVLATGLCFGLFLMGWHRDLMRFRKGGGAWMLYLGFSLLTTFAALLAQARGALLCIFILWILILGISSFAFTRRFGLYGLILPGFLLLMAVVVGIGFISNPQAFERQKADWIRTFDFLENPALESRYYLTRISMEMISEHPWLGQGTGSFRYLHLPKLAEYPELRTYNYRWKPNEFTGKPEKRKYTIWYKNAHMDLLEYLVEWGFIGCLFPLAALFWILYTAVRARLFRDPGKCILLGTVLVVLLGATFEFHFRIPLVLLAWCLVLTATCKLAELENDPNGP